jgi:3-methylcrotonyl-CoA carboxylase alpha subunit
VLGKILIANRGEIACRVARTARRLGVRTVAVHSDIDAGALHVAAADEAVCIGAAAARESYLRGDRIIEAAKRTGAGAIHPGYGFLSENEAFAAEVAAAGLVFVGPPPAAIRAMGSKSESKRLMESAGVPLVPGYHGEDQDPALLAAEAARIGYPVLIKASAGGGGKGMRIVEQPADFAAALASARREAASSFGDDRVLVEKYLLRPRHVEIQVFADTHGRCVHLFERDCSVQRRHQKVIEEAPAPGLGPDKRARMGATAVAAARAVGYVGAGTVEFIVDAAGEFFFMEMNTRLQVEHPVTEMITGLDLVEWQLRVAAGEPLPLAQEDLRIDGHAIEARLYAEDPENGFLPSVGRIVHLREPAASSRVRIDTGIRQGDAITQYYDPMIAKLVVHGATRDEAVSRLRAALGEIEVVGVATNAEFLRRVVGHHAFAGGSVDTGLIDRHRDELIPARAPVPPEAVALAAAAEARTLAREARERAARSGDPHSPFACLDTWWLNADDHAIALHFADGDRELSAAVRAAADRREATAADRWEVTAVGGWEAAVAGGRWRVGLEDAAGRLRATTGERTVTASVVADGEDRVVVVDGSVHRLRLVDRLAHAGEHEETSGHLLAPMSGSVVAVLVKGGERVEKGQPLIVVEAMKMEHTVVAPAAGVVEAVYYAAREQVTEGVELVSIVPDA